MLVPTFIYLLSTLQLLQASPLKLESGPPITKRCTNAVQNPSFETGESPWQVMALGSWETRGIYTSGEGGHDGQNFFYAHANATVAQATINLSQYGLSLSNGATADCSAWVASHRPGNSGNTRIEVMLDGQTCGTPVYLGTTGWMRVGGQVKVGDGPHTLAVIAVSDDAGPEGASVWIDDVWVGVGC